ncbi:MAG: universal stress protein [Gammaproteobacteria bacterium]|nr:universal stress protein [Gammaproteobacteria bacterium]
MRRFLVATDLSARSDRALERALILASEYEAALTIVHVIDEDLPAPLADVQQSAAIETISGHVDALTTGIHKNVSIQVVVGRPHSDILEIWRKTEAEMIILGMHREDAFKDMFRGTTVERVMRGATVPVLLVKERARSPYQRVMLGIDFSVYSRRAVEFAIKFTPNAEFHLVHAYHVPFGGLLYSGDTKREVSRQHQTRFQQMMEEELAEFLTGLEMNASGLEQVMQEGTVREVIYRQVDRFKPELLVIGTRGRTGVAHAFLGSIAEDLLSAPPCDVLAVKSW